MVLDMAKIKEQREYHIAWDAWKRCCKKVDSQGEHFTGIHDRLLKEIQFYRESQLAIGMVRTTVQRAGRFLRKKRPYL